MASVLSAGTTSNTALNLSADTTGILQLASNGSTTALTIDTSQNVGIGTASPTQKLEVNGRVLSSSLSVSSAVYIWSQNRMSLGASVGIESQQSSPLFMLTQGVAQPIVFGTNSTERMRIDSSGNVGIGLNPSGNYQLEGGTGTSAASRGFNLMAVSGGFSGGDYPSIGYNFRTTASSGSYTYNATDIAARILFSNVGTTFSTAVSGTGGNAITWSERMRITSGGDLLVGTSSDLGSLARVNILSANGEPDIISMRYTNAGAGQYWRVVIGSDNTYYLINDDSVGVSLADGGTSWSAFSDERLKTDLKPIENAVNKVTTLRAVTGRYKTDEEDKSRSFLIAQDVQNVLPEAVSTFKQLKSDDETEYLSLSYTEVIPLLVAAIKELKAELDATKAEVAALKGVK